MANSSNIDALEALLAEGERQAKASDAAKRAARQREEPQLVEAGSSQDLRRHGRGGRGYGSGDNRYSAEREENDKRRSIRSGSLAEEDDVKEGSDKGSANGSVRSRRRSRSPDSDRRPYRSSPRDRDSFRERDRPDRGGDYYSGGGRPSLDDRYRPGRNDDYSRPRERERSPRRGDRERYPRSDRGPRERRPSPQPRKVKTPEPTDDERDRRTVFVQQLAARLRTRDLKNFFEQVGPVVDAQIVKDRVSGRSKGQVLSYLDSKTQLTSPQRWIRRVQG